jgi:N-acetylglucosaminyl-diphospho-decaprenol L-rhamnosyltransferase
MSRPGTQPGYAADAFQLIRSRARMLALRLRLRLTDLKTIESWADEAILTDGAPPAIADLCLATRAGERITQRILDDLGGPVGSADVMRALAGLDTEAATQDDLRRLSDNLDPILKQLERAADMPKALAPAVGFAREFWRARMEGAEALNALEQDVRDVFDAVREYAADIPDEHVAPPEDAAPPRIAAIVVSYHTGDVLFDCLAALEADEDISEIVLVNNGNPPAAIARLEGLAGKLKTMGEGLNRGFAAGVNLGVAATSADRFLIINPDAILQPGSVVALESAITHAAEPAIVGGRIYGADGREQRGARRRKLTMRSAAATFLGVGWLRTTNPAFVNINRHREPQPAGPVPMDAVSGALMYMTRHGFERLGGFDEGYFMHVEDLDICRRAEADGGAVIYTPFASALHHGATSDAPSLVVERHKAAGLNRYFRKFAGTRGEQAAARVLGPVIGFLLVTRARLKRR